MTGTTAICVGTGPLLLACVEKLTGAGWQIALIATDDPAARRWAEARGIAHCPQDRAVAGALGEVSCDWLFSIANLNILPAPTLACAREGAVNFHDGPLPAYAGLNTPNWAILNGETEHGVCWHLMTAQADAGGILARRSLPLSPGETALSLNARCFEAGLAAFDEVLAAIAAGTARKAAPADCPRRLYRRDERPEGFGAIDPTAPAEAIARLVAACDHGTHPNRFLTAWLAVPGGAFTVGHAEPLDQPAPDAPPGLVLAAGGDWIELATATRPLRLSRLAPLGHPATNPPAPGTRLEAPAPLDDRARAQLTRSLRGEEANLALLRATAPLTLALANPAASSGETHRATRSFASPQAAREALWAWLRAEAAGAACHAALADPAWSGERLAPLLAGWAPLDLGAETLEAAIAQARERGSLRADLDRRNLTERAPTLPDVAICAGRGARALPGAALSVVLAGRTLRLVADGARISPEALAVIADRLAEGGVAMSTRERRLVLETFSATETELPGPATIPAALAEAAARWPKAPAVTDGHETLSLAELDELAARIAAGLAAEGVKRGQRVGIHMARRPAMVAAALAVMRLGAAYVPLDPDWPADRLALYVTDSAARLVISDTPEAAPTAGGAARVLSARALAAHPPRSAIEARPDDAAYVIYTSGSTGRPKGVVVEHRNVINFFAGMDARIPHGSDGVWLAVTSLSFDISVLELFWAASRGYKVVLAHADPRRGLVADTESAPAHTAQPREPAAPAAGERRPELSLFFWGNDDGPGRDKYRLLLDAARFADAHGFAAVWTPERHFHAFGGPYPNPAVTGAAVAAVTRRIGVRAGSCVLPLHHPARVAEEWAVIDNLTGGRAGLAVASGWQPDDFVLRPENAPPANHAALADGVETLRALWRGEAVTFPGPEGRAVTLRTQPRPVSPELPLWITTAGNPGTWEMAGRMGARVLTHLLGQSIDELAGKIALYRKALAEAGHGPEAYGVALMLHTHLGRDRAAVREAVRGPMKDYLRSAAGLIRQYAWAFPAFKRPQGASSAIDVDLEALSADELDAILDFAFERYFSDSGLFGTVDDAAARLDRLAAIGVSEVACLIDFGLDRQTVMAGLQELARLLPATTAAAPAPAPAKQPAAPRQPLTLAALATTQGATHLQCTPSLMRLLLADPASRAALAGLRCILLGGEAVPGELVAELRRVSRAEILVMYGPTETTIWSTTAPAEDGAGVCPIGRPIANTRVLVLDDAGQPVPIGQPGELWIGGAGVARGYLGRPELTAERFRPDPFAAQGRLYRTGDLARWRADGVLEFLGRADDQVKINGHRIEPAEIEAVLADAPGIAQAVVTAEKDASGVRLIAHLLAEPGATRPDPATLRAHAARRLPAAVVPAQFRWVEAIPLTPNGKIDRRALAGKRGGQVARNSAKDPAAPTPSPRKASATGASAGAEASAGVGAYAKAIPAARPAPARARDHKTGTGSPRTVIQTISEAWESVLGRPPANRRAHFFDEGGHSLLAVALLRQLRSALPEIEIGIADIFRAPVLEDLATTLAGRMDDAPATPRPEPRRATASAEATSPAVPKAAPTPQHEPARGPQQDGPEPAALSGRAALIARRRQFRAERLGR